jgi:hypothetical protein
MERVVGGDGGWLGREFSGRARNTPKSNSTGLGGIGNDRVSINYAYPVISQAFGFEQGPICGITDQMTWTLSGKRTHCFVMGRGGRNELALKRLQ